jgi:hypothetical protein
LTRASAGVAASDIARSADLIPADRVNEFNGGGLSTVSGWLDLLPYQTVSRDRQLSAAQAWIALNVGHFDDARIWIEAVEAATVADTADEGGTLPSPRGPKSPSPAVHQSPGRTREADDDNSARRRKPNKGQPLASDDRSGATKARPPHVVATAPWTER